MTKPEVSIVIPTFNQRPEYLASTLASAIAQTVDCEIIVVDDGSDEPVSWVPGVRIIRLPKNRGISTALNVGIEHMAGEWFCWLPSDDLYAPNKVEVQLTRLKESGLRASYHRYYTSSADDGTPEAISYEHRPAESRKHLAQRLASGCVINGMTTMIHRQVFRGVGLFDQSLRLAQDWEMWCRITQTNAWLYLPESLATRRTKGNLTERVCENTALSALMARENAMVKAKYGKWWA